MNFWDLTPEQIRRGMDLATIPSLQFKYPNDPMIFFVYDSRYRRLGRMWVDCDGDMTLMRLKYHDEIEQIMAYDSNHAWFAPAGLRWVRDLNGKTMVDIETE